MLGPGNNGNEIVRNILSDSGTNGIRLSPGTTMNVLRDNVALGNTTDARDLALLATGVTPASNQWVNTTCETDVPVGLICVPPVAVTSAG